MLDSTSAALAPTLPLATRTVEVLAGPARLFVLPTATRDVVSFRGSFLTAPDLGAADDLALGLVADVLDKGTRTRDRHAFADDLDGRGARLSFYSDSLRIGFAGRALRSDLADVLALAAEALRTPLLDDGEIRKAVDRSVAGVRRSRDSTAQQASGALARRIVGPDHPNYVHTPDDEEARTAALTPDRVREAWARHVGSDGFTLALVGDVDPGTAAATVADRFGGWQRHGRGARFAPDARPEAPGREDIALADRTSLDVRLGHAADVRRNSPDFLAAYAAVFALGGNFSSRLMQTVRDEQGLTYGISASLGGVAVEHDATFGVSVTLSQENLERGIAAVRAEVERFVDEGVSAEALQQTRTTLAGQHVVALATTGGLAARLLVNAERGFDTGYLDRYPDLVRALEQKELTDALRRYVRPTDLHTVVSGTLPTLPPPRPMRFLPISGCSLALVLAASGLLAACNSAPAGPVTETGELATGDLTLTGGEFQDNYTVRAKPGQWIKVDLRSTAFDPYIILRTPSNQQSENDDHGGDRNHSQVVYQVAEDGQFQIIATSFATGETGAYTLVYEVSDAQPAASPGSTAGDAPPSGTAPDASPDAEPEPTPPAADEPEGESGADAAGGGGGVKI